MKSVPFVDFRVLSDILLLSKYEELGLAICWLLCRGGTQNFYLEIERIEEEAASPVTFLLQLKALQLNY